MKMATRLLLLFQSVLLLSSCSTLDNNFPPITKTTLSNIDGLIVRELGEVGVPTRKPSIAVYPTSFIDQTGQRASSERFATFSTAITQAPYAFLISALAKSEFFDVVERIGLDNLTRERQIIRSTRESFDEGQNLMPLAFAGLIIEGGVIAYEANNLSGGSGAQYLGIGARKEYRQDIITIALRTVSVSTGQVLTEVLVTKNVLSVALNQDVFRFISNATELIEIESGVSENESISLALRSAIETAVLETIIIGLDKGYWSMQ